MYEDIKIFNTDKYLININEKVLTRIGKDRLNTSNLTFINNTYSNITIIPKTGFKKTIKGIDTKFNVSQYTDNSKHFFTIRKEYIFDRDDMVYVLNKLNEISPNKLSKDMKLIYDILHFRINIEWEEYKTKRRPIEDYDLIIIPIDYSISFKDLEEEKEGVYYLLDFDLVIAIGDYNLDIKHPFDLNGNIKYRCSELMNKSSASGYFYELITNDIIEDRYKKTPFGIIKILGKSNKSKKSGVYFTTIQHNYRKNNYIEYFIQLEEAENVLGLYKTEKEALNHEINLDNIHKNKLIESQKTIELLKSSNIEQNEMFNKQQLERKIKIEDLKNEIEILKNSNIKLQEEINNSEAKRKEEEAIKEAKRKEEEIKRKEEMDKKSYEYEKDKIKRKNRSDIIKTICGIALVGLSLIGAIIKILAKV
jgi:hypothetical protein